MTAKILTLADLPPMSQEEKDWWNEHDFEYYHYLYRIDNIINGMFYYGIHSQRKDLGKEPENDGYMGSGTDLKRAQKEEGLDNFKKTIVKIFSTRDEARLEEMRIVTQELVDDKMCYNLTLGGGSNGTTEGFVPVNYKDPSLRKEKFFMITCEEYQEHKEDYIIRVSGYVAAKETSSDRFELIPKDEYQKNKDKYTTPGSGYVIVKNESGDGYRRITLDEYYDNKDKYILLGDGKIPYKNKDDWSDIRELRPDDPLVISGQFIGHQKGTTRSDDFRKSISGEKNGSHKSFWITDGKTNKKLDKDLEIPDGWRKGRVVESYIEYINLVSGDTKFFKEGDIVPEDYVQLKFVRDGSMISPEKIAAVLLGNGGSIRKSHHELRMDRGTLLELIALYEAQGHVFKKKINR